MDRRTTAANDRVAHVSLQGRVAAPYFTEGTPARILTPVADLLARPGDGARERQLLIGAEVTVLDRHQGFAFVQAHATGYVGYLPEAALGPALPATHRVHAAASFLYPAPSIKVKEAALVSLGARLTITADYGTFSETDRGLFVISRHLSPLDRAESDPVAVAERLIGTPYLWGGDSREGIDCSGLVRIACEACAIPCPGDSDQQQAALGTHLPEGTPVRRGDLVFWKGHVAWVAGDDLILHANGHDMAVAYEGLAAAIARIAATDGPVTAIKRLPLTRE